jgi:hypothetical protein
MSLLGIVLALVILLNYLLATIQDKTVIFFYRADFVENQCNNKRVYR